MAAKQLLILNMSGFSLFTVISQHIWLERWFLYLWRVEVNGSSLLCRLECCIWEQNKPLPLAQRPTGGQIGALHPGDEYNESQGCFTAAWPPCYLQMVLLEDVSWYTFLCDHFKAKALLFTSDMGIQDPSHPILTRNIQIFA